MKKQQLGNQKIGLFFSGRNLKSNIRNSLLRRESTDVFKYLNLSAILLFIILLTVVTYYTGGTNSFVHLMYLPLILSVFLLGTTPAVLLAAFAGLCLGPFMPYNVELGISQSFVSWGTRLFMFMVLTRFIGLLVDYIKKVNKSEQDRAFRNIFNGYPNFNKWKYDMNLLQEQMKEGSLSLSLIELTNLETINRYIGYTTGNKALLFLLELAKNQFPECKIYSVESNRILVASPINVKRDYFQALKEFFAISKQPVEIDGIPVAIVLKAGFLESDLNRDITTVYIQLGKALEKACHSQKEMVCYTDAISLEAEEYYQTLVEIYKALDQKKFFLVYHPKYRISDGQMDGVEALIRWDNSDNHKISVAELIRIAEDAGFITYITKWLIEEVLKQQNIWLRQGIKIKIAVNLSARDFQDPGFPEYIRECIWKYKADPEYLELELTERSILEDEVRVFSILNELRKTGIKTALDDYGTGHNSLLYLIRMGTYFDHIKIDKVFIDMIEEANIQILVKGIVDSAHGFGAKVIAEGVENEKQRKLLADLGCDLIQGYYYSKPLKSDEIIDNLYEIKTVNF